MKILYVEDNEINAFVLSKFFKNDDFEIATSGEKAIEVLRTNTYDVLLIDINLGKGKMDGIELLSQINHFPNLEGVPKVAVTAYAMPLDEQRFLQHGFDAYFAKPIEIERLNAYLAELV